MSNKKYYFLMQEIEKGTDKFSRLVSNKLICNLKIKVSPPAKSGRLYFVSSWGHWHWRGGLNSLLKLGRETVTCRIGSQPFFPPHFRVVNQINYSK